MPGMSPRIKLKKGRPLVGHTNVGPAISITANVDPVDGGVATTGFAALATDAEQGDISSQVVWSTVADGRVGTGSPATLTFQTTGAAQVLTATITDGFGAIATDTVLVTVNP